MAAPNPLSLLGMGIGTIGGLVGGIQNAFEAPARKRKFLEDEKRKAQVLALRNSRWDQFKDFYPTNAYDAKYRADAVAREAEDNPAYNANPLSFLPFVGNAAALAGGIYDYANEPVPYDEAVKNALRLPGTDQLQDPPPTPALPMPSQLELYDPYNSQTQLAGSWRGGGRRYG